MTRKLSRLKADSIKIEVVGIIQKWRTESDNEELMNLSLGVLRLVGYITALEMAEDAFDDAIDGANDHVTQLKNENWELRKKVTELQTKLKAYEL